MVQILSFTVPQLLLLNEDDLMAVAEAEVADFRLQNVRTILDGNLGSDFRQDGFRQMLAAAVDIPPEDRVLGFFNGIRNGWNRIQRWPGEQAARHIRGSLPDGGENFCMTISYCENKARIAEGCEALIQIGYAEDLAAADDALDEIREKTPEGFLEWVEAGVEVGLDVAGDTVIPGAFFIKAVKYGADKLCPCCEPCNGSGRIGVGRCDVCEGTGSRVPFPRD